MAPNPGRQPRVDNPKSTIGSRQRRGLQPGGRQSKGNQRSQSKWTIRVDNPEVDNIVIGSESTTGGGLIGSQSEKRPEVDNGTDNAALDRRRRCDHRRRGRSGTSATTTAYGLSCSSGMRRGRRPAQAQRNHRRLQDPIITMTSDVKTVTQNVLVASILDPVLVPPGSRAIEQLRRHQCHGVDRADRMHHGARSIEQGNNVIVNGASIDPDWIPKRTCRCSRSRPVNTPDAPFITEPPLVSADR